MDVRDPAINGNRIHVAGSPYVFMVKEKVKKYRAGEEGISDTT